ncbi:MAG: hypothetical protein Q9228_001989 [Teloschistes exilis]
MLSQIDWALSVATAPQMRWAVCDWYRRCRSDWPRVWVQTTFNRCTASIEQAKDPSLHEPIRTADCADVSCDPLDPSSLELRAHNEIAKAEFDGPATVVVQQFREWERECAGSFNTRHEGSSRPCWKNARSIDGQSTPFVQPCEFRVRVSRRRHSKGFMAPKDVYSLFIEER